MKKQALAFLAGGLVLLGGGCVEGALEVPSETVQKEAGITFQPEIPVDEYWDFGSIQGLRLYVNNTDKNVIYALDESGRVVWTIWGKDYGIVDGFEIRLLHGKLFVTDRLLLDPLGGYYSTLHVFAPSGNLLWRQIFSGYLDMPQVSFTDTTPKLVILVSGNRDELCDRGCGILCSEEPARECNSRATWAFELETGKVAWVNTTRNYYGLRIQLREDGKLFTTSGGIGPGRYGHTYALDPLTGDIEEHSAYVSDPEFGRDASGGFLFLDENRKTISLKESFGGDEVSWSLSETSMLYHLFKKHLDDGSMKAAVLDQIIYALEIVNDGHWQSHAFRKSDGGHLWSRDFDSENFTIFEVMSIDGILLFTEVFPLPGIEKFPHFTHSEIWGVDESSGRILWRFREPGRFPTVKKIFPEDEVIQVEIGVDAPFYLNVRTGSRVPFTVIDTEDDQEELERSLRDILSP